MRQVVVNDLVFGSGRMKICVPVCEKTTEAVLDAVKEVKTTPADLIEWRIDYFDEDMFAAAPEIFKAAAPLPVLCTFRTKAEGGEKAIDPMDYFAMNAQLSALGAPLVDLELFLCEQYDDIAKVTAQAMHEMGTKLIISNHDFAKTPAREEIADRYKRMMALNADLPKIAVMPQNERDVMVMLAAMNESTAFCGPLIGISMGELGKVTRVRGGAFGSVMTFASKGKASAPGQIDAETLSKMLNEN